MAVNQIYDKWNKDTPIRQSLIMMGLNKGMVMTDGTVYRYDYWERIPKDILVNFPQLREQEWFDEDCGWLYLYVDSSRLNNESS